MGNDKSDVIELSEDRAVLPDGRAVLTDGSSVLTDEQRRLVRDNIGLVGVHLHRSLGPLAQPKRDREWEDLFQEGCLGLMQAALTFREKRRRGRLDSGIPFAAFALPRIHNAVSRALQTKFSTVHIPLDRREAGAGEADDGTARVGPTRPRVHSMSDEMERRLTDRRHDPSESTDETVGDRLRAKYERAVRAAVGTVGKGPARRGDRDKLARVIADERFLIPDEASRTALRRIARQTNSSYARVAQCDKRLAGEVRHRLTVDPEFCELSRRAKADRDGTRLTIDAALERRLDGVAADEFINRLRKADPRVRAQCLDLLSNCCGGTLDAFLQRQFITLAPDERERLFHDLPGAPG